jgi:hypothetical protein
MDPNKLISNFSRRKAAEFSGGSGRIPLPKPAFSTNPCPSQRNSMATAKDL